MKKIAFILVSCFISFAQAQQPQNPQDINANQAFITSQQNLLDDWITKQGLIGKTFADNPLVNNQTVSLDNIKQTIPDGLKGYVFRVVKPNMAVTMDYSYQRVNIEVDNNNIITRIYVG